MLVAFYRTTRSPLIEKLSDLYLTNEQKRSGFQSPVKVAQCFIHQKRTTEVRSTNPTEVVVQFLVKCFAEIHLHTTATP